jgi:hypothetical protein
MRMMMKAVVDTAAGNAVIADGSIGQVIGGLIDRLHPEAAYFAGEDGQRACFIVFDMTDAADLPSICEPLFQAANARVTVTPCMNLEDMQQGLSRLTGAAGAPAADDAPRMPAGVG